MKTRCKKLITSSIALAITAVVFEATAQTYVPGITVTCVTDWQAANPANAPAPLAPPAPGSTNFSKDKAVNFTAIDFAVRLDGTPSLASASPYAWRDSKYVGPSSSGPADRHTSLRFVDSVIELTRASAPQNIRVADALIFAAGVKETKDSAGKITQTAYSFPYVHSMPVHSFRNVTISSQINGAAGLSAANLTQPISVSEGELTFTLQIDSIEGAPLNMQPLSNVTVTRTPGGGRPQVKSVVPVRCDAQKLLICDAYDDQKCSEAAGFADLFAVENLYKRERKDVIGGTAPPSTKLYKDTIATRERLCQENSLGSFETLRWNPEWSRPSTNCTLEKVLSWNGTSWESSNACGDYRIITYHSCLQPTVIR